MNRERFKKILAENKIEYQKLIGITNSFDIELEKGTNKAIIKHIYNIFSNAKKTVWDFMEDKILISFEF